MPFYTWWNKEYFKWRILIIEHVELAYFTLSYFELIVVFIGNNLLYSIGINLFKMRVTCYNFFILQDD